LGRIICYRTGPRKSRARKKGLRSGPSAETSGGFSRRRAWAVAMMLCGLPHPSVAGCGGGLLRGIAAMPPLAGSFLVARGALQDPNFVQTVILLLRHGEEGAFGLIVNRPAEAVGLPFPVFRGGPCPAPG